MQPLFSLPNGNSISEFEDRDRDAIVAHMQDRSIYDWTFLIPWPYTAAHAEEWLATVKQRKVSEGFVRNWAIRDPDGNQIGGIGLHPWSAGLTHVAELGYWIASPWRGRGIMTSAIAAVTSHAFTALSLTRLTATIFTGNAASARALEKNGFTIEAPVLRKHYCKDGRYIDAILYALVKP